MALVFCRSLAPPLWALVFLTVFFTASPPASRILTVIVGIAVIAFVLRGVARQVRPARLAVPTASTRQRHRTTAALSMVGGMGVRTLDELKADPDETLDADQALDLVRVDGDGSWQLPDAADVQCGTDRR